MGIALLAIFALAAVAASSASASAGITYSGNGKFAISSGEGTLETATKGLSITCSSDVGAGHLNGTAGGGNSLATTASLTVAFKGCKSAGKACTTTGAASGEIKTTLVTATIGEDENGKAAVSLTPESGTAFVQTSLCGTSVKFEAKGSVVALLSPEDKQTKTLTATFTQTSGVQEDKKLNGVEDKLEAELGSGFEPAGLASVETLTLENGTGILLK
jgi:hypothetical protein